MRFASFVIIMLAAVTLTCGCLTTDKPAAPAKVYVTPCNLAGKGVQVHVSGTLESRTVKPALEPIFVDDFTAPGAEAMRKTYTVDCYWANNANENKDYYYCSGKYKAPDLDENRVIKRFLLKEFKIGFSEEHTTVGSWVDSSGKVHNEGTVYYLTVRTVDAKCSIA
jgi:hypothetical protein